MPYDGHCMVASAVSLMDRLGSALTRRPLLMSGPRSCDVPFAVHPGQRLLVRFELGVPHAAYRCPRRRVLPDLVFEVPEGVVQDVRVAGAPAPRPRRGWVACLPRIVVQARGYRRGVRPRLARNPAPRFTTAR